ncbi:kinase [Paenibacillus doosanensis]|uniref:kinase n=1 Tax=Paenibacillus doosanensis TaxID=1229154 RepID=UPI00217F297A|nr:kinase [Paenibacillus doosanensis]MCS7464102.1 kinase [Paenibacillus doosanensis]
MRIHIETLMKYVVSHMREGERLILGIDGLSRSGKTTLACGLEQELRQSGIATCVLHMDDYIVERAKRYNTDCEPWEEYYRLQWDVIGLEERLFRRLKGTGILELMRYDAEKDSHEIQRAAVSEACVVIIEGVFLQRKEWRKYLDVVAYVDSSRTTRFLRESEITRRKKDVFVNRYWKAEDYYITTVAPARLAELVLHN